MNASSIRYTKPAVAVGAMAIAVIAAVVIGNVGARQSHAASSAEPDWAAAVESGADHIAPIDLARELLAAPNDLRLVDLRPAAEFAAYHLPTAVNLSVPEVCGDAGAQLFATNPRLVVLYSNGPAHPGQAWVELQRQGRSNVKVLAGGLLDFRAQVLTPPSLREDASPERSGAEAADFALTSAFLLGDPAANAHTPWATDPATLTKPTMVSGQWLQQHLATTAVLDLRSKTGVGDLHLPGAVPLELGKLRQKTGDRELHFVDDAKLAAQFGALGIGIDTPVVLYTDVKEQDVTLAALAFIHLGHRAVAILEGGILRWATERRPLVATATPMRTPVTYSPRVGSDDFSVTTDQLAGWVEAKQVDVLDVRPPEFFRGDKTTEARAGHIPGAKNRFYTKDLVAAADGQWLLPRSDLQKEYDALALAKDKPIVVSCRTGHTASHTYFVLRYLLGRDNVHWYNGSWTEWAEHKELPAVMGDK